MPSWLGVEDGDRSEDLVFVDGDAMYPAVGAFPNVRERLLPMGAYSSGDDPEPLTVEDGGRPTAAPHRTLVVAGLLAVVLVAATLGVRFGQASSKDRGGVVTTECSGKLVCFTRTIFPPQPLQIYADLRGGGDASLPLTTDQVLVAAGIPTGHQSFRPAAGGLTVSFRLPPSASISAEIQDENGTVLRRTQLAPLVQCESP